MIVRWHIGWIAAGLSVAAIPAEAVSVADVLQAGSPSVAMSMADQALAAGNLSDHDRARVLIRRGLAEEQLGQRSGALEDLTKALAISTLTPAEKAEALYDRGVTLDELNQPDDAIGDYSAALSLHPRFAAALNNLGNAYRRLGRMAEARRDYEASIAAGNNHPEYPQYGMGQIAEALGQTNAARNYYRAALLANPQFTLATERLAALGSAGAGQGTPIPPPEGTDDVVHLRPPAADIVHLHPPRERRTEPPPAGDVTLKPAINDAGGAIGQSVQLGAWRTEAEARDAWTRVQALAGIILAGLAPSYIPVDLPGKGHFIRLRVVPTEAGGASQLCNALKTKGIGCMAVPS